MRVRFLFYPNFITANTIAAIQITIHSGTTTLNLACLVHAGVFLDKLTREIIPKAEENMSIEDAERTF